MGLLGVEPMSKESVCAVFLLLSCLLFPSQVDSQEPRQAEKSEHVSGVLVRVYKDNGSMDMRTKSRTQPGKETTYKFHYGPDTKITKEDGKPADLSELREGSVVTLTVNKVDGESRATLIVLQNACTPDTCARSNCKRKCNSDVCKCPKI
jgi:hypothetical protein